MIGKTISHYKILGKLGEGGMGVVYKAEDTKLKRNVALKFLSSEFTKDEEAIKRFEREAQATASLNHPNIVTIYEINEHEDQTYIVMECVAGETLTNKIKEPGDAPPLDHILNITSQICEGLQAAHEAKIVHRDIKPGNIMIDHKGRVRILDFGLAKLSAMSRITSEISTIGTVQYMSPEQVSGDEVDHRSDIWSVGILLYEMLTGQLPFKGERKDAVMYSILNTDPEHVTGLRTGVPMELERIINKALAKSAEERYQGTTDLLVDLRKAKKDTQPDISPGRIKTKPKIQVKLTRRLILLAIPTLVILLLAGYFLFKGKPSMELPVIKPGGRPSIAVLPLMNISGDQEQQYLVDGMHDAMITELSKIGALRVIARLSAMRYKNTDKPLSQISKDLKVEYLVEGTVFLVDNQMRVTTQLIHAVKDENVWADSYDRPLEDIRAFYSEVAQTIASKIRVTVTPEEKNRLGRTQKVDPEAYRLYLKGNFQVFRFTEVGARKAIGLFQQALKKDPAYAEAYSGLALAYLTLSGWHTSVRPTAELNLKAKEAALKAIKLNSMLAAAHVTLGRIKWVIDWDWAGADEAYKRGMTLNPRSWFILTNYANYLRGMGRFEESIELGKQALEMDPLSVVAYNELGCAYDNNGQDKKALEQYFAGLELDPDFGLSHGLLSRHYAKKGLYEKALTHRQKRMSGSWGVRKNMSFMGFLYGKSGRKAEAMKILNNMKQRAGKEYVSGTRMALIHLGLDQKEEALEWLEKAYKERDRSLVWLKTKWIYDPLRDEPRFKDLMRRMNYPD